MNTIEALQKLYVAMGGQAADVANLNITPDMINAIAEVYQGGGGGGASLPAVTAEDNDKLLTVVNGEWDKAEAAKELPAVTNANNGQVLKVAQGSWQRGFVNETVHVHYSYVEPDPEVDPEVDPEAEAHWECDVDAEAIINFYNLGKNVIAHLEEVVNDVPTSILVPLTAVVDTEDIHVVTFGLVSPSLTNDPKFVGSIIIQHSVLMGINVESAMGYLSATDPNT